VVYCIPRNQPERENSGYGRFLTLSENNVAEKEALDVGVAVVSLLDERFHL
jgi:hypothetical protein